MKEGVFAKVGDSNLSAHYAPYGLGFLEPSWGGYEWLEPAMRRYREVELPRVTIPGVRPSR